MIRNIKSIVIFTVIFTITAFNISFADSDYQVGTRGEGIGFAFSVLADEPFGSLYNPAGPAFVDGLQAQAGYQMPTDYGSSLVDESPYGLMMGVNYRAPQLGAISFSTHRYGSYADPSMVPTTNAVNFAYSQPLGRSFALGLGVKYLFESDFEKRSALDFDLGAKLKATDNLAFALVLENLSRADFNSDYVDENLARKIRFAAAYHLQLDQHIASLLIGSQLSQDEGDDLEFTNLTNIGTEMWFAAYSDISLGLRGGYTFGKKREWLFLEEDYSRWSAGFSLNFDMTGRDFRVDYAIRSYPYETDKSFAVDHFVTLNYGWGGVPDYFAGKEPDDEKYDLSRYQKSQDWQTPESVEQLRESETKVEKPAEQVSQPKPVAEPVLNSPVGMPKSDVNKPAVQSESDRPEPVSLTIIETPQAEQTDPVEESVPPVSITEPEKEAPSSDDMTNAPVSLTIVNNQVIADNSSADEKVREEEYNKPQSKPLEATDVGTPAPGLTDIQKPQQSQQPEKPPLISQLPSEQSEEKIVHKPKRPLKPQNIEYQELDISLDANQFGSLGRNKVVFSLRPNSILHLEEWKLYVFAEKPKNWNAAVIDDYALAVISGKGVTPLTVVWDGTLERGGTVQKGKYVFVVVGRDSYDTYYKSDWHKFKVK